MATFIPFPSCCEANIQFALQGIPAEITLGFRNTDDEEYTASDLADLASVLQEYLVTPLAVLQTTAVNYVNIHMRALGSDSGAVDDLPLTNAGSASGAGVTNQASLTVTFLTGIAGRSYRGRNYIGGLPNSQLGNLHTWGNTVLTAVLGVYEGMDEHLAAASSSHVVLSRYLDKVPRETGHAQDVIGYRPNSLVATQRRRLR